MSAPGVRREKAALPVGISPTRQLLQPEATGATMEVTKAGVITPEQRFTLHGLKHRGVTDTKGSRRRKQIASGHQTEAMV